MAPRTRKGKICEGCACGTGMLRVGEGEEDHVQELENESVEGEEQVSFKEFYECEELKA